MSGDRPDYNPFAAPESQSPPPLPQPAATEPVPCPRCRATGALPAPYDAWYGRRAPKAIQDVVCQQCGAGFNGETGVEYPPRKSPLIWFLLALALFGLYLLAVIGLPLLSLLACQIRRI